MPMLVYFGIYLRTALYGIYFRVYLLYMPLRVYFGICFRPTLCGLSLGLFDAGPYMFLLWVLAYGLLLRIWYNFVNLYSWARVVVGFVC